MHLKIDVTHRNGYAVLAPEGEVDVATSPDLKAAITSTLVEGGTHVVVDLLAVEFIDSTGLGALIGGRRRALAVNGSLSLVLGDDHLHKVFQVTGLDKVFTIFGSVEDAVTDPAVAS
jgi:anti-sigma B factor antagonist